MLAGRIGRNDGLAAALSQPIAQLASVVGTVCDQLPGCGDALHQRRRSDQIVGLPGRDGEGQRPTGVVAYGVNFGRPSAARSADGLLEVPPFAPATERCALTWVESTAVVLTTPLDPLRA
jgi:hypothetical protein